ncbi:MAG: carboxypeptidase regulatory-like domain-containing protein [Blastocatellia bacterium]|nr:carboxypeptidase regulatory-like domain-containing protein [Blastocatellia bacterium]
MFSRILKRAAGLSALLMVLSTIVSAQTVTIEGTVKMKAADGTLTPVAGALIDIYRMDIRGHYDIKTDKTGRYVRVGLPVQGTFLVVVSGPGIAPTWVNNVRLVQSNVVDVEVTPGDGTRLTLEQVKAAMSQPAGGQAAPPTQDKAKTEAEQKEYEAKAKEAKDLNESFNAATKRFNQGVELMKANNYQAALSEFEAAGGVDVTKHEAFYEVYYKANASAAEVHYQLGVPLFNEKKRDEAKTHFQKAVVSINKAISAATSTPKPNANINNELITYYNILVKNARLLIEYYQDADLMDETAKSIDKAKALDASNKIKWDVTKGDLYRIAFRLDEALAAYQEVLAADKNNVDAMYGIGLSLISTGDEAKLKEAEKYLKDFVSKAPADDKRVPEVKESLAALESLRAEQEKPAKGRKKP